mgnify:FL=1
MLLMLENLEKNQNFGVFRSYCGTLYEINKYICRNADSFGIDFSGGDGTIPSKDIGK